jgi:hypothetical protein
VPLDEDAVRLAQGKNLATVVTLMPSGQPQALLTWVVRGRVVATTAGDEAREHIDELSRKYVGTDYRNPIGPQGRIILKIAADKVTTPKTMGRR